MEVIRQYGNHGKTIRCNVPPNLPGDLLQTKMSLKASPRANDKFGNFSLSSFMTRYVSGYRSLKEARNVSRKRLALVNSHIGFLDPEAYQLNKQIQSFNRAKEHFKTITKHNTESFLALHRLVAPEQKEAGYLRTKQNWIGGKTVFKAAYVCPPPEVVAELLQNLFNFLNDHSCDPHMKAIISHCQIAAIHPFLDGNGRMARLFLDGLLEKHYGDRIPLLTYRLSPQCNPGDYLKAIKLMNVGKPEGLSSPFWQQALTWTDKAHDKTTAILNIAKTTINQKICMSNIDLSKQKLLAHLWTQPIVCTKGLLGLFEGNINNIHNALDSLMALGILQKRLLRAPQNAVIYDCPIIFEAYHKIDDALAS